MDGDALISKACGRPAAQHKVAPPRNSQMQGLRAFLDRFIKDAQSRPSHTLIAGEGVPGGAFSVPQACQEQLFSAYIGALEAGATPSLTERPSLFFPVIVDIDLRYVAIEDSAPARVHGQSFVCAAVEAFADALQGMTNASTAAVVAHVMERDAPYVKGAEVCDGLHIIFPGCILTRHGQAVLRDRALPAMAAALTSLPGQQSTADKSVDTCYCTGNNWQMYGSAKPGRTPYLAAHTLEFVYRRGRRIATNWIPVEDARDWSRWVRIASVSMATPDEAWPLNEAAAAAASALETEWAEGQVAAMHARDPEPGNHSAGGGGVTSRSSQSDIARARRLTLCLSAKRADAYDSWRNVALLLHDISSDLVDAWHAFSAKSPKYDKRVCQLFWDKLQSRARFGPRLGFGSLVKWAAEDSPQEATEVQETCQKDELLVAIKGNTHTDWARYLSSAFPGQIASVRGNGSKDRQIWIFRDHRWQPEPDGITLKNYLKDKVTNEIEVAMQGQEDDQLHKSAARAIKDLKTKGYRESIVGDLAESVGDDDFLDKLDAARDLLCFNNGVFDMEAQTFRAGRPEDYVSMCTRNHFAEPDDPQYASASKEVDDFMSKVHVCPVLRKYCLDSLAVMLSGRLHFEHMHCWTGLGSNGKSRMMKLVDDMLGDYAVTLPPTLLTSARPEANKATPELCSAKGARLVVMSEVDGKATINVAVMKELSGGDKISVRALYANSTTIKPQFSMIMTCNDLSKVDSNDDGTWRRLKVLPWKSKFVFEANPEGDLVFEADNNLDSKTPAWAPYMISMLLRRYPAALQAMRTEPQEITANVKAYRTTSDRDADFVSQALVKHVEGSEEDDADAWMLLELYKRFGRDKDITLAKLIEKLARFGIPPPVLDAASGTARIPGYRLVVRGG